MGRIWSITDREVLINGIKRDRKNIENAVNEYNLKVFEYDKITVNDVYHGLDYINNNGVDDIEEMTDELIKSMENLLIDNDIIYDINKMRAHAEERNGDEENNEIMN